MQKILFFKTSFQYYVDLANTYEYKHPLHNDACSSVM